MFVFNVPVIWYCKRIGKVQRVSVDAITSDGSFLCDCGKWVKKGDNDHKIFKYGYRSIIAFNLNNWLFAF